MLPLDDPRWRSLTGGRGVPYDASPALLALENGEDAWPQLWAGLQHQGDLGTAAYAALPQLVRIATKRARDWNLYALAAAIEVERHRKTAPLMEAWAVVPYDAAWTVLRALALRDVAKAVDQRLLQSALSVIALSHGARQLGAMLAFVEEKEISGFVEEHLQWSGLYV